MKTIQKVLALLFLFSYLQPFFISILSIYLFIFVFINTSYWIYYWSLQIMLKTALPNDKCLFTKSMFKETEVFNNEKCKENAFLHKFIIIIILFCFCLLCISLAFLFIYSFIFYSSVFPVKINGIFLSPFKFWKQSYFVSNKNWITVYLHVYICVQKQRHIIRKMKRKKDGLKQFIQNCILPSKYISYNCS